jgi:cystathionine beta-lyase
MQFDQTIERRDTYSFKWEKYKGRDILPMWVADTEFRCPEAIIEGLKSRLDHGLLGYTLPAQFEPANQAIVRWLSDRHNWQIDPKWIVWTPGVVPGFNMACKAFSQTQDKVLIQTPNYPPLLAAPGINGLQRVDIPTLERDGRWTLDMDALARRAADPDCHLLILCNPMNPVGSVLTEEEMQQVATICNDHDVILCSDEIHCDLILDKQAKHLPAGNFPGLEQRSVTLMAASKTFNVAGLGASFAIIPNAQLRSRFVAAGAGIVPWVNVLGLVATEIAFTQCDDWHAELLTYLRANLEYIEQQVASINGLRMLKVEATFLAWIDASGLGVENPQQVFESAGVGPSPGADFGDQRFVRINFGCPKSMLEEAFNRLKQAKEFVKT